MPLPFTLRQLEYFDAVASEGSLVAAAERCHVSPSALALAIDELESRLALQLVIRRKGKGIDLAPAGARLLAHARQLLAGAEAFAGEASQSASGLRGRFVIGCFPTLAPFFLPGVIDGFRRLHDQLAFEFVEAETPELHENLLQGRIDAALMYGVDVASTLSFEPLRTYRPYVIVAADHPLAGRGEVDLADLVAEPLIQLNMQPSRQNTEQMFARVGLTPTVRYTTTNYEFARCLVGRGLGYSILVQRLATPTTYDGHDLATVEISGTIPSNVVGLTRPSGSPLTAKYRALRDVLLAGETGGLPATPAPPIA
ncbi:MAG: LysR substrate-binding domain-containing protein [Microbacterium sp.]|uniref:LysR substrate-binding domain-containing protein n=1 Tax=Microbacterium sp. TaxID=51671 RepID=UPI00260FBC15|nr:LysR substrate-binding domain-containing protein [Microbacterium sp.]MCX6503066.1 LysR substrate-binding domain-containing protein [Microbacterium sp.]